MVTIDAPRDNNIIYTTATGKLSKEDYDILLPKLNEQFKQYDKIRWYFEMKDFEGWDAEAFWKDLKMDLKHYNDFDKIAMVGNRQWEKWLAEIMKPFTPATIKYFDIADKQEALDWIAL